MQRKVFPSDLDLITIYGPTASGKTAVAVQLAAQLGAVIFSGDSRQVYRGMDIGTGKDLDEYVVEGHAIPYQMIDIAEAGEEYNLHRYMRDFYKVYDSLPKDMPKILCGGTGLYMTAVLGGYKMSKASINREFREKAEQLSTEALQELYIANGGDIDAIDRNNRRRLVRAIEVARAGDVGVDFRAPLRGPIFCIDVSREVRRARISSRLKKRLDNGMVEEVRGLMEYVEPRQLIRYGLEYKWVTEYLLGQWTYDEMFRKLETAIHQFAKRQMTWVRGMERRGYVITYLQPSDSPEETARKIGEKVYNEYLIH